MEFPHPRTPSQCKKQRVVTLREQGERGFRACSVNRPLYDRAVGWKCRVGTVRSAQQPPSEVPRNSETILTSPRSCPVATSHGDPLGSFKRLRYVGLLALSFSRGCVPFMDGSCTPSTAMRRRIGVDEPPPEQHMMGRHIPLLSAPLPAPQILCDAARRGAVCRVWVGGDPHHVGPQPGAAAPLEGRRHGHAAGGRQHARAGRHRCPGLANR